MHIKYKALAVVGVVTVLTAAISGWSSYATNAGVIESAKQRELRGTATLIQNDLQEQTNKAAARAAMVVHLPSIQQAFRKGDREQLVERLAPSFLIQRDKYGVREGQFHLPPATSFLRIYDPKAGHGEDLSGFREMVLATNRTQEAQKGIEIGRRGLSIRGVDVVKDEKGSIGSFEVGISFSTVLENLKKNAGFEAGAFVDAVKMADIATLLPKPDAERLVGAYQNVEATNWKIVRPMVSTDLLNDAKDVVTRIKSIDGVDYGVVAVPLLDYKGSRIGAIVAVKSFEDYQTMQDSALIRSIAFALLQAVFLAGAMLILINVLLVQSQTPVAAKE
ncbi:MAG: cache domain-containing protein [Burkholderiales bacterium]